ncbi:hypothetical protein C2845_PM09G16530 [Panicum miliaceum]|uniref:Uncharacterized protein n=1 Tax=Panicum miliaceum TaxID=4540 RepID=A0A3L6S064_PANMI|nr:hypothetical protein C2845_PM09G16530 [Panicum miliaceum]
MVTAPSRKARLGHRDCPDRLCHRVPLYPYSTLSSFSTLLARPTLAAGTAIPTRTTGTSFTAGPTLLTSTASASFTVGRRRLLSFPTRPARCPRLARPSWEASVPTRVELGVGKVGSRRVRELYSRA